MSFTHGARRRTVRLSLGPLLLFVCCSGIAFAKPGGELNSPAGEAAKVERSGDDAKVHVAAGSEEPKLSSPKAAKPNDTSLGRPKATASSGSSANDATEAVEPRPPPSAEQLRAYRLLAKEAAVYETGARDYRKMLNMVVRHHYEVRRRRILSSLNSRIEIEQSELVAARDEAISRLKAFVAHYSGDNADPIATPDAMFRLAALYEEKARLNFEGDLGPGLVPAIALYLRIIEEYPAYEEIAAVHYYLGHAYTDSGGIDEGQQTWRALVCANQHKVRRVQSDALRVVVEAQSQDHEDDYWFRWYQQNPVPLDQAAPNRRRARFLGKGEEEELTFRDPYAGCEPLAQKSVSPGEEPRYLAEVWWQLGNFHFDGLDSKGGPYVLNRGASAYAHALKYNKPPLFGVSLYKLAWSYFKQQRYRAATEAFVRLLYYADEQEKETGESGADFRAEAYTYIAGSLTYVDFDGPPADDPYIPRSDVLDLEMDPVVAESKMAVALERIQDPKVIPQSAAWTVEVYKALAQEFVEITQNRNAVAAFELTLRRFPLDRDAPVSQNRVAELYDELSRLTPDDSAAHREYASQALEARTALAAYVGVSPWTEANKDDPEALQQAEMLVRTGLQRAAADHTNFARQYYNRALELNDVGEQRALIEKSIAEYRLAEKGWFAYLEQDPAASDAYDSRFWLADARYMVVVLQVALERTPTPTEVESARVALVAARDSNEDDRYLQPAAFYLVNLAEQVLKDANRAYEQSGGARGVAPRLEVQFVEQGGNRSVVTETLPSAVMEAVTARDEYNARIPLSQDPERNGMLYAYQAADYFFVYGQFQEARRRLEPVYKAYCGQNEWGYRAWEKLISMSNFEGNAALSRSLADATSCAYDEETKRAEEQIRKPVKQGVAYLDARGVYEQAEKMAPSPERDQKWREAAAAYKVALDAAPDRDEAPEAAMNGAYAYKQVGEYDKAIAMYELFIQRYGDSATLGKLRTGDSTSEPPTQAQPQKFEERVGYLKNAHDALAAAYVLFFNYPRAAETFDSISQNEYFAGTDRRDSARQALSLYASLGDAGGMARARQRLGGLGASPREVAEADYIVATSDLKRWDRFSPNSGANAQARGRAQSAMEQYFEKYRKIDTAAQYVTRAAYYVALTKAATGARDTNEWRNRTIEAFRKWKARAPSDGNRNAALGSAEAGMAAEADYAMVDEALKQRFDYETGHHRYKGTSVEVIKQYQADAVDAKRWLDELQRVVNDYVSPEWSTVAVARQGSLYDSLRTGLYNTRPPELKMFDAKVEKMLQHAEESDNLDLQEKADAVRMKVRQAWRERRDRELESADRVMVDRYSTAVVYARRFNVSNPAVTQAIRRLAFSTDLVGEARMKDFTSRVADLGYQEGMFSRMRPGIVSAPKPDGMPPPLPVALP